MRIKSLSLLAGLVLLGVAYPVGRTLGQAVYGSIIGTVTDSSGAAVPNAKVTITSVDKGVSVTTTSNESGNYEQQHLIAGTYDVKVEAPGFQASVQKAVQVNVDAAVQVNATLQLGQVTQTVEVTAAVPMLKTERTDVATQFSEKQVEDLPVFNRNFTDFELLTPGTQLLGWQHASSENPQESRQIMVNGQHFSGTAFQLDGTDNRDPILGIIVINPNLDAVTEAKVTTADYDAEFGQATAGVVTAQTKSGSNGLHGSAFWFRRDNNLTARDPFSQTVPLFGTKDRFIPDTLWNQFGGSLGGPIRKDKTFIFGDYQGTYQSSGGSVLLRVPNDAERGGNLSDLGVNIFDPYQTTDATHSTLVLDSNGNPIPVNPGQRTQFPSNTIPASRLSIPAENLLKLISGPNIPGSTGTAQNFSGSGQQVFNSDGFDVRADQYQTEKLHLFGRYSFARFKKSAPGAFGVEAGGPDLGFGFGGQASARNQSIASGFDYTLNPAWLTDFRFGFYRYRVFVNPNGLGTTPAKDAGVPGLNLDTITSGMPAFFIDGTGGFNFGYSLGNNQCNCPLDEEEQQWQWVNNWTNIRGNHTLKFGADIRYAQNLRVPSDRHRAGELTFHNEGTEGPTGGGLGLATFLLGDVNFFSRYISKSTDAAERQKRWFFYGQDTWRVTPKLSVNYGLRWEIYFPQTVTGPSKGGFVQPKTGEVWVAGTNGIGLNGNVENTFTNFAPRLGAAYQLKPNTVIRMGYGRSFDIGVFGSTFGHSVTQNLPVLAIQEQQGPNGNPYETAFNLAQGPVLFDAATALQNNCLNASKSGPNPITNPDGSKTQCLGVTGRPLLPDGITSFVLPFKMRMPTVDAWNATVQHQLSGSMALEVAYVANKGTHIFAGLGPDYNFNQPTEAGFGTISANQRKFFYPKFGWSQSFRYFGNDSNNNYESLQTKFEKRFSQGYSFVAHYTLARAYFHDGNYWPIDGRVNYGPDDFQRTHVFVLSNIVDLPFGKGKRFLGNSSRALDLLVGGWQVNAVTTIESGSPFDISYQDCGADRDNGPCRPDRVGTVKDGPRSGDPAIAGYWFQIAPVGTGVSGCPDKLDKNGNPIPTNELTANGCTRGPWERPGTGASFGKVKRNAFRGPKLWDTDFSAFKNFQVTERVKGQFRAESFNIFNHINLSNPDGCVDCGTGGRITGDTNFLFPLAAQSTRMFQFALRFDF